MKGLSQNRNFLKYTFLKVRNSVRNREIIAISYAKLLEWFSKKSILQQPHVSSEFLLDLGQ